MRAAVLAASLVLAPSSGFAQEPDGRVTAAATLSTSPMRRDVSIINGAGQAAHRLAELGLLRFVPALDDRGAKGIAARAAQLYLVSLPLASITHVLSHEYGHADYVRRVGGQWTISVDPLPWPFPIAGGLIQSTANVFENDYLGVVGGGSEAAFVHQELVADRIYTQGAARYFDWLQFVYVKLDTVVYSLLDLSEATLRDPFARDQTPGDPRNFVLEFERLRYESESREFDGAAITQFVARARSIRKRAATSLLDLTLISGLANTFRYLATGDAIGKPLTIPAGPLRFAPGLHFMFTPAGFEHRAYVRVLAGAGTGAAYVRRITSPGGDDLTGGGATWSWPLMPQTRARVRLDTWRTRSEGLGYLAELGGERTVSGRRGFTVVGGLGYKSSGVLEGYRPGSGIVAHIGGAFRF